MVSPTEIFLPAPSPLKEHRSDTSQHGSVVAEWLRAPNSNSGVSDQQSVGSNSQP